MKKSTIFIIILGLIAVGLAGLSSLRPGQPSSYQNAEKDEAMTVGKYLRDNIKDIATNQPVLGGSWYVVGVTVDTEDKSGTVTYEDGHIQSKAIFKYIFNSQTGAVTISDFRVMN